MKEIWVISWKLPPREMPRQRFRKIFPQDLFSIGYVCLQFLLPKTEYIGSMNSKKDFY